MRKMYAISALIIMLSILLTACGGADQTPTPTPVPAAGGEGGGAEPPSEPPTPVQPVNLAGPDVGTSMAWVDGSTLVFVPPGEFIMGHGEEDNPEHPVFLDGFWIYRTEVTNRMYALCVGAGICPPPEDPDFIERLKDPALRDKPVINVNWEMGTLYCEWAGRGSGHLPTEAQWEKSGRGPEGNLYPWGDAAPECDLLNFDNCTGDTTKVREYPQGKSFYELLDTAGNTLEWVGDWYKTDYYAEAPFDNPLGPETGEARSVRGSSFESDPSQVSLARRFFLTPDAVRPDLGFRCVVEDPQPAPPYCVTSAHGSREPGEPSGGCELSAKPVGSDCGFATADLEGGTITSVESDDFDCTLATSTRVYCSGGGGDTGLVTICGVCEGGEVPQTGMPGYECDPAYETSTTGPNECDYQGGDNGGCPPGTTFDTGTEQCMGDPTPGGYDGSDCPSGTYLDTLTETCVGDQWPGPDCLPGYEFNPEEACCELPGYEPGDGFDTPEYPGYPGCGPDEYYDTLEESCLPTGTGGEGGSACLDLSLTLGECSSRSGGNGAITCASFSFSQCGVGNGCYWDTGNNICAGTP